MLVYRFAKKQYIRDLSGTGARIHGGRWNRKGTPMLYASEHCSLALLELLVHTPHNLLPNKISLLELSIPADLHISTIKEKHLPQNWQQYPAPDALADWGSQWLSGQQCAAIKVPSVVVPKEWNLLLNPDHKYYPKISIKTVSPFPLDSRF